jgi:hypothetical protein
MGPADGEMPTFQALSSTDKLRVNRCLARGKPPADPRLAAAAVEAAEYHQRKRRSGLTLMRWLLVILIVGAGCLAAIAVAEGNRLVLISAVLILLSSTLDFMLNPIARPKNMARSLEASRRRTAS